MENQIKSKKDFFAEWLEKLQQESWQLELLISGLALYGIFWSGDLILSLEYYFAVNTIPGFNFTEVIAIQLLWTSRTLFLINLLLHIIIRGFWIGAIGLRYVSGNIDYDELNYSDQFTNFYKRRIGNFDTYIERLENFSSILFSFTFLLFFLLFSFFFFNLVAILASSLLTKIPYFHTTPESPGPIGFVLGLYYFIGFLVLIDFITLGAFKKIADKTVGGIYFWIYRFYSIVSLSFFYRPLLLNFIDNRYTKRLFLLAIPYGITMMILSGFNLERHDYFPSFSSWPATNYYESISENIVNYRYYDDLRNERVTTLSTIGKRKRIPRIHMISLSQYEVDKSELKLFLEYEEGDNLRLDNSAESIFPYHKSGFKHFLQKDKVQDEHIQEITAREMQDIKQSSLIGKVDSIDLLFKAKYGDFESDRNELMDRIAESYTLEKSRYAKKKSANIKNAFLDLYDIHLNNKLLNNDLDCKYYIHPNMLEKGLLCYLNIDSLSYGGHMLTVTKSNAEKLNIPFRKIKQNQ